MQTTPRAARVRPSLGEPSRVQRSARAQSPGASSVGSVDDVPGTSPRRRSIAAPRPGAAGNLATNRRDPRAVGDRAYAALCVRRVIETLSARGYSKTLSYEKLLKDPSTKDFFDVFQFLIRTMCPELEFEGKLEDEVPWIMRRLKYPTEVNRSKLQAISGPNTWPQLLAVLDWLTLVSHVTEELVEPLAACSRNILEGDDQAGDDGAHHVLRIVFEHYLQYLQGEEDRDLERMRQMYEERTEAHRGELERLQEQYAELADRRQMFDAEHERLLELQRAPAQLQVEADRHRATMISEERRVQQLEDETAQLDAEYEKEQREIQDLEETLRQRMEVVQNQAYSKRDIERIRCERDQAREILKNLHAEAEKVEQAVWEFGMAESRRAEAIARVTREANNDIEALQEVLLEDGEGLSARDFALAVDTNAPSDTLAAVDFQELVCRIGAATSRQRTIAHDTASEIAELQEELRCLSEEVAKREREHRRPQERYEQAVRTFQEYQQWSAEQLDEARRTQEATEDALRAVSTGTSKSAIRDAAEIDKLQLTLEAMRRQAAQDLAAMREQDKRDQERLLEHRQNVIRELDEYAKDIEGLFEEYAGELILDDAGRRSAKAAGGGAAAGARASLRGAGC